MSVFRTYRKLILTAAFLVAAGLTLIFGVRTVLYAVYWADPDKRDQVIAYWMTPRYVARSWDVPPAVVAEAIGVTMERSRRPQTLEDIAEARGETVEALAARIDAAILSYRSRQ